MQLTYRGVRYDYTPNPAPEFGAVLATGTYRGASVIFRALATVPAQPRFLLTWRGNRYLSGPKVHPVQPTAQAAATAATAAIAEDTKADATSTPNPAVTTPKMTIVERARSLFIRRHQKIRQREQSMLTRLDEEVGLTAKDAAHYESQIQGKVPHNFAGYDRSDAAMS